MLKKSIICGSLIAASGILVAWPGNAQLAQSFLTQGFAGKQKVRRMTQRELAALLQQIPDTSEPLSAQNYDSALGKRLADYARRHISGTRWNCYAYVARAIHAQTGPFLEGLHAYEAAEQLAKSPYFKEVRVSLKELSDLPVGAVVVWDKGKARSGHISIADGQGNEISDHVAPQMLAHYGGAGQRTFLPVNPQVKLAVNQSYF